MALLVIGIIFETEVKGHEEIANVINETLKNETDVKEYVETIVDGGIPMIVVSGIIVGITILGIFVACTRNKWCNGTYVTLLVLLLIGMVALTIFAFAQFLVLEDYLPLDNIKNKNLREDLKKFFEYGLPVAITTIVSIVSIIFSYR